MRGSFAIFLAVTKNWMRTKTGVFFSFLFPVMLLLIFGTIFGEFGPKKYTLNIQNLDLENGKETNLSSAFINALNSTDIFEIERLQPDVNVTEYIETKPSFGYHRILIIPENFQQNAINKSITVRIGVMIDTLTQAEKYVNESEKQRIDEAKKALQYWKNATKTSGEPEILLLTDKGDRSAPVVRGVVYSIINKFNNRLIGAEETIKTSDKSITQRKLKVADYYVPGYIAAFIMTNGVIGVTSVISEYKRNGTIKRLTATPLPKISWIIGNISQQTLLAFALAGIMIILGWLIFGTTAIPDVYAITLMFLGAVAFCGIGIILGGVIKDVEAATGAGNAIAFPMMFLSGAFWPVEMMPDFMQTIAKCLPLYYFHEGLREIMIYQNPSNAILAFIIVGSLAVIFILLAAKITRWKEL